MTREEAIKLIDDRMCWGRGRWSKHHMPEIDEYWQAGLMAIEALKAQLPSVTPEITDEQAILHLQASGWMQRHDKEMYESGLRERLADDSGSYDSLIPCDDTISRQMAIDEIKSLFLNVPYSEKNIAWSMALTKIRQLPSAQPERSLWFRIGEICVDESKGFISAGKAFEKIRELLREAERLKE